MRQALQASASSGGGGAPTFAESAPLREGESLSGGDADLLAAIALSRQVPSLLGLSGASLPPKLTSTAVARTPPAKGVLGNSLSANTVGSASDAGADQVALLLSPREGTSEGAPGTYAGTDAGTSVSGGQRGDDGNDKQGLS